MKFVCKNEYIFGCFIKFFIWWFYIVYGGHNDISNARNLVQIATIKITRLAFFALCLNIAQFAILKFGVFYKNRV